jgi:hypothetical protein
MVFSIGLFRFPERFASILARTRGNPVKQVSLKTPPLMGV